MPDCPAPLSARPGAIILLYAAAAAREAVTLGVCATCATEQQIESSATTP